jgi:hypothetical protein
MAENDYFVQIRDPVDIRRSILGSSKQIIQILQRYERIKALRVKKLEKISQLRMLNKEVNLMVAKLKKEFPAAKLRINIGKEEKKVRKSRGSIRGDDLGTLEADLRMIEDKIGRLG